MAKRFTDTDKWDRPWFRALPNQYKLLWFFILDRCDIAGVWYVDMELASFQIGTKLDRQKAQEAFEKQIEIRGDRWLIKDFIGFQYGSLEASNKIYKNVTAKLNSFKEGAFMPHTSPIDGVMVMDKEKDKDGSLSLGRSGNPFFFEIPEDLKENEPEIRDWVEYKKQRHQPYKSKGLEALWRSLRSIPKEKRRESIDQSMANNWSGIFEKRSQHDGHKNTNAGIASKIGEPERADSKYAGIIKTIRVGGDEENKD